MNVFVHHSLIQRLTNKRFFRLPYVITVVAGSFKPWVIGISFCNKNFYSVSQSLTQALVLALIYFSELRRKFFKISNIRYNFMVGDIGKIGGNLSDLQSAERWQSM